jgi:uncharacterized damage-inducible protein DinB
MIGDFPAPEPFQSLTPAVCACPQRGPQLCLNIEIMNAVDHFTRLFAYDAWANRAVLAVLRSAPEPPARSLKFIAHVLASERLWLERLEKQEQTLPVWPEFTREQCGNLADDLSQLWKRYLAASTEADLAHSVSYRNSKGEAWKSRKDDILTHVITHSAYHRGQIAADMRGAGVIPAYTDFIHSVRQGFVE